MLGSPYAYITARQDFERVRRRANLGNLWNRLVGRPRTLLPFSALRQALPARTPRYLGVREIPVAQIVGSVERARDFDRHFRPLQPALRERWIRVRRLHQTVGWPPIDVYAIGGLYFVEDGHHRVSVAHTAGLATIEARVHEFPLAVTLAPDVTLSGALARLWAATARPARRPAPLAAGCGAACAA